MLTSARTAFGRLPIRVKIITVLGLLIAFGFVAAGTGTIIDYRVSLRESVQNNIGILAQAVGDNCQAALAFGDPDDARETLKALAANTGIIDAILFDDHGREFAHYTRDADGARPTLQDAETLLVRRPIQLDGDVIGSLLIRSDLAEWRNSLARFVRHEIMMFVGVMVLTVLAALYLERLITDSLQGLVTTTRRVSVTRDYSLRAQPGSEDEFGELVVTFNEMLAEIERRDEELMSARDKLGEHVVELEDQRRQLGKANDALQREVHERKQAERELERHARALKRSNGDLEQFAYATSHDLQEPLRGIAGSLQLLEKHHADRLDDDARTLIGFAADGASRLKRLVHGLLAYSRVNSREPTVEPVDCEALRRQVLADLALAIDESGARVTHDPLPVVAGDAVQLPLIFQNLISNAIKFRGDDAPEIHLGAEREDDGWVFSVQDNGIGIEPRFAKRIFEIFQRLHGPAKYEGTGIGLAVVKKIVERHNGRIWVDTSVTRGTRFCFTVPDDGRHADG